MVKYAIAAAFAFVTSAHAGTVLWNGFFNSSFTVADFDKWSFSNEIQPWQWYIHGPGATSEYLAVSADYKNPADTSEAQGIKTTIDGTSFWNGQTMERTEIIPQTSANLGTGHLYYHFSLKTSDVNPPNAGYEHQIAFFESHFTELKYGLISGEAGTTDNALRWDINSQTQWSQPLVPNVWMNFAYDIDFSAGTVALWYSEGSDPLTQVHAPVSTSPSTNSADWHIGVLRLPNGGTSAAAEDYYWSGIYVESGSLTTSPAGPNAGTAPSGPSSSSSSASATSSAPASSSSATTVSTTSSAPTATGSPVAHYGQCGGIGTSYVHVRLALAVAEELLHPQATPAARFAHPERHAQS
ncbi:hypothetical protein PUNSTDRAFT_75168 [Punctularia strigosozonata HHB-11173 SS5]|uniref:Glycoside hydrolase 131 catalytic N-terminal domain-containing protein n=1 Tax=Punctularia strigosozonata (strain HHB-11173) TaxID=741275 RepID=R7S5Y4_PUNST|nr:uncharacterized protein PUNSTDRAFT_75168 [Punctularia strigosozonata HHB-11173 SS5]EIN05271.1 hypothetical protein PUNSTDRAFT_75168 [Punctularia strigosozonata HHB-11173 SS5]